MSDYNIGANYLEKSKQENQGKLLQNCLTKQYYFRHKFRNPFQMKEFNKIATQDIRFTLQAIHFIYIYIPQIIIDQLKCTRSLQSNVSCEE